MRPLTIIEATNTPFGPLSLIADDIVSNTLAEGNHWNPHVYDALRPYLSGTVIDVGANVGALTLRFARRAHCVIAYEPHPVIAECLHRNVARLGFGNVTVHSYGLYSREIFLAPQASTPEESPSSWTWLATTPNDHIGYATPVPLCLLARPVTAIKVDAQGADLHALIGLEPFIRCDRPRIVFEFEDGLSKLHGHTWEDYVRQLGVWGYTIRPLGEGDHFAEVQD